MIATGQNQKVRQVGQVIRCICILGKQVPALKNYTSAQIIIPQKQTGRKSGRHDSLFKRRNNNFF